jgi:Ser/Thr protein kinase RdoA (MazF antagonist)
VERVTLHLAGPQRPLELVRKQAPGLEIAGLRAAQAVRMDGTAIPELVAYGPGWLITPLAPGAPLARDGTAPANLFDTLAALHARYQDGVGLPAAIPRVTLAWWQRLCRDWAGPQIRENAGRQPPATVERARALLSRAATDPAVPAVLAGLTPTLLHGDVHPGNVLVAGDQVRAILIDWGSSRVGPAMLDLANLVAADSAGVAQYAQAWQQFTGQPLAARAIKAGYRWAAVQIPIQYLPWTAKHRPARDVEAILARAERALEQLPGAETRMTW